jgi:hypothetical protein
VIDPFAIAIQAIAGIAILCLGRRLFWLFVGVAGFVTAFELVPLLFPGHPAWLIFCIALAAGVAGGLVAVGLQYVAAALAGFAAGVYVVTPFAAWWGATAWMPFLGGILGALVLFLAFDWALIVLSAFTGSSVLVSLSGLQGHSSIVLWLLLAAFGIGLQASLLSSATHPLAHRSGARLD